MGPYGSKYFKKLLLLQIAAESSQTFPELSSQWSTQTYVKGFLNFENLNVNVFVVVNMKPNGSKKFKTQLLQIADKLFKPSLNFPHNSSNKTTLGTFEILSFRFFTFFFYENIKFTIVHCEETKNLNYLENQRS